MTFRETLDNASGALVVGSKFIEGYAVSNEPQEHSNMYSDRLNFCLDFLCVTISENAANRLFSVLVSENAVSDAF